MLGIRRDLGCLVLLLSCSGGEAAPPPVPGSQLTVDVVTLKQGSSLRGAVLEQRPNGDCLMVVSAHWLKEHAATRHAEILAHNSSVRKQAWQTVLERIHQRLAEADVPPRLKFLFEQEQTRLGKLLEKETPPAQFLWVELPRQDVVRVARTAPERRRVGIYAWYAELQDVEQRSVSSLQKELKTLGFPLDGPLPDLGTKLSPREQSEREWAARMAVVEFGLSDDPLEFQGTGATVIRVGNGRAVDWQAIFPGLLEQQTQQLFQELLGPTSQPANPDATGLKSAIQQAQALQRRAFRMTRVDATTSATKVHVESRLVVQVSEQDWQTVWSTVQTADSTVPRPELEQRISADPQVRSILRSLQSFNVVGDDLIRTAIRHGAATMDAQSAVDGEFFRFRDRYLTHLDSPYLPVPVE